MRVEIVFGRDGSQCMLRLSLVEMAVGACSDCLSDSLN